MKNLIGAVAAAAVLLGVGAAHAGKKNNSLTIALSEPVDGVAEFFSPSDESQLATRAVLDRVLSIDHEHGGKILPLLATSWKQVDSTTWDLTLRNDVKFHDGSAFDADDVVYTLNWAADPSVKMRLKNRFSWIAKAEKLGPTQVRIKTTEPNAVTLLRLAIGVPIVPSDYHKKFENKADFAYKPIGTGAYKAASVDRNTGIVLVPNENYIQANAVQPKGKIAKVTIKSIADEQTRIAQMMVDNVDLTRVVSTDIGAEMKADPRFAITAASIWN